MKVGVLGSGFGLYGYMPALMALGAEVAMPRRYLEKLQGRSDVARFEADIDWRDSVEDMLSGCDALIVSQRPGDQVEWVKRGLSHPRIGRFLLEKPLAPAPDQALAMLNSLDSAGRIVRAGFNFRYTPWAARLRDWIAVQHAGGTVQIDWTFRAHHYQKALETWKRHPSQGGGALRFYAVHLIALLAEIGYSQVADSRIGGADEDDAAIWTGTLTGDGLPACSLLVDSDVDGHRFSVTGLSNGPTAGLEFALNDPFDELPSNGLLDRRVTILSDLCRDFLDGRDRIPEWYYRSVALWAAVEAKTA